jgi:hypothetical protein
MKKIEIAGTANVGEFSPLNTPLETSERVTTANTQATLHSTSPADPGSTGGMTKTHEAPIRITRK